MACGGATYGPCAESPDGARARLTGARCSQVRASCRVPSERRCAGDGGLPGRAGPEPRGGGLVALAPRGRALLAAADARAGHRDGAAAGQAAVPLGTRSVPRVAPPPRHRRHIHRLHIHRLHIHRLRHRRPNRRPRTPAHAHARTVSDKCAPQTLAELQM